MQPQSSLQVFVGGPDVISKGLWSAAASIALLAVIAVVPAGTARTRSAHCTTSGYNMQAYTYYRSAGDRWEVYKYSWRLSGNDVRRENNMNIKLQDRRNDQPGNVHYSVSLGGTMYNDNRAYQHRNITYVNRNITYVRKSGLRVTRYQAVFDRNNRGDPHCSGYTRDL